MTSDNMPVIRGQIPENINYANGGQVVKPEEKPQNSSFIDSAIKELIEREGGFVNNPKDRGGPTKYGITQKTLSDFRGKNASIEDVKNIDKKEAAEIYKDKYYRKPEINKLPENVREQVFDISVNSGPSTAIKMLQETAGIKEDGVVGPQTIAESKNVSPNSLVENRIKFYKDIVKNDPSQKEFIEGWINRAKEFK